MNTEQQLDIDLPCNVLAEQVVLGCLIEDSKLLPGIVATGLEHDEFILSDHQRVFQAILDLHQRGSPIDYVSVAEQLGNASDDFALLGSLIHGVVVERSHALHQAKIVRRKAGLRAILKISEWMGGAAADTSADPELLIHLAIEKLQGVRL